MKDGEPFAAHRRSALCRRLARAAKLQRLNDAAVRRLDDVIDVEAEPVEGAAPRAERPAIVVEVKGKEIERAAPARATVKLVEVEGFIRDVEQAAKVGAAIGDLFRRLFR